MALSQFWGGTGQLALLIRFSQAFFIAASLEKHFKAIFGLGCSVRDIAANQQH